MSRAMGRPSPELPVSRVLAWSNRVNRRKLPPLLPLLALPAPAA
jgi:hypothetical protein